MTTAFVTPSVALNVSSFTRSSVKLTTPQSVVTPTRRSARMPCMLGDPPVASEESSEENFGPTEIDVPETSEMVFEIPDDDDEEDREDIPVCPPPKPYINAQAIAAAREKFRIHETDSGSPEFQIATLTTRITYLTAHLKENPKDHSCTRGLLKLVATRRRLLKYLKGQDVQRFHNIVSGLNIRISAQLRQL